MRALPILASILLCIGAGCGMTGPQSPGGTTSSGAIVHDNAATEQSQAAVKAAVDGGEKDILHTFDVATGKADPNKTRKKAPVADLVTFLRAKKFPIRLGKEIHSRRETLMLDTDPAKQEFNDHAGKSITSEQRREIFDKFDQLQTSLQEAQSSEEGTVQGLLKLNMAIMMNVSKLYAERAKAGVDLDDVDYGNVAQLIVAQRRVEQLAATSIGLVTAYHAVIQDPKKDPNLVASFATKSAAGFPTTASATTDDAKAYVASLKKDVSGAKERYEGWTRDIVGAENFSSYQRGIDDDFAKIEENLATAKSKPAGSQAGGGGLGGMVNAVTDLLPIDGRAKTAVRGLVALASGDLKGAATAGLSLVPDGPLKQGLSFLTSFL
ncbi:MAG: hypothetical protein JWM74_2405 [Myxococcaceae bacterium]|nr:hypothetical protein [Myxococcaceae bacterium]